MKKLGVIITDCERFGNFVMSDFITETLETFDKNIINSMLLESCNQKVNNLKPEIRELTVFKERKITRAFRKWKEIVHLQKYNGFHGMNDNPVSGYPKNNSLVSYYGIPIINIGTR